MQETRGTSDVWTYRHTSQLGADVLDPHRHLGLQGGSARRLHRESRRRDVRRGAEPHRRRHRPVDLRQEGHAPRRHRQEHRRDRGADLRQPDEGPDQGRSRVRRLAPLRRRVSPLRRGPTTAPAAWPTATGTTTRRGTSFGASRFGGRAFADSASEYPQGSDPSDARANGEIAPSGGQTPARRSDSTSARSPRSSARSSERSSPARRTAEGCIVTRACVPSASASSRPRSAPTRALGPSRACAAVAPRQTTRRGRTAASSSVSQCPHLSTSDRFGLSVSAACPPAAT